MAIDSRNKRSSAINVASPWRSMLPLPDGTIDQADRQHAALHYSGILAGLIFPAVPLNITPATGVAGAADTSYFIKIYDPYGNSMPDTGALYRVEVSQAKGVVGSVTFSIPGDYDDDYLRKDGLVEVYRIPRNRAPYLLFNKVFFLRRWTKVLSGGNRAWKCTAYDPNYLLGSPSDQNGRVVAYDADSAQAKKTAAADDMLKAIMRENVGSLATDTARDLSTYLTIQADTGDAPSISKEFSNRVLVPVLNEICQASWTAGVYLTWDIVLITPPHKGAFKLEFRTYTGQRGEDHRAATSARVILGTDDGRMDDVEVDFDFTEEVNYIRAGGQDNGAIRKYKSGGNTAAIAQSPFNRRETFLNMQNVASLTTLQHEIDWALKAGVPEPYFSGTLTPAGQAGFDLDWAYGDYVTTQAEGRGFDARVDGVTITFDRDNGERINPYLNGYNPSPGNPIEELQSGKDGGRAMMKSMGNSIARLQKRVQTQGRRQEFIRPYEVVSSGLLPPVVGGVGGPIALFDVACPTGWTEYTAAQGRVIVGVPAGGTVGGTVGSALSDLATRTISTVAAHVHALGGLAAANESAHTHGVGTYNNASEAAHTHAAGTLATDTELDHTHGAGSYDAAAEAAHTHGVGTYNNAAEAAHTHSINPPSTQSTDNATAHGHQINPPATTSASGGSHSHEPGTGATSGFIAGKTGGPLNVGGGGSNTADIATTDTAAAHTHSVDIAPFTSAGEDTLHSHTVNVASFTSAAGSSHDHAISGSSAAGSSHDHAISGSSAADGSHAHDVTGSTAAGASHDHAITGNSGAGSSHGHTLSGSVASTGTATVDVTMPYIQLRLCQKV